MTHAPSPLSIFDGEGEEVTARSVGDGEVAEALVLSLWAGEGEEVAACSVPPSWAGRETRLPPGSCMACLSPLSIKDGEGGRGVRLSTCSRASLTRSLNVVNATSWRAVEASPHVYIPYIGSRSISWLGVVTNSVGFHFGFALLATCSCSSIGAKYTRPLWPSATIAKGATCIRPA